MRIALIGIEGTPPPWPCVGRGTHSQRGTPLCWDQPPPSPLPLRRENTTHCAARMKLWGQTDWQIKAPRLTGRAGGQDPQVRNPGEGGKNSAPWTPNCPEPQDSPARAEQFWQGCPAVSQVAFILGAGFGVGVYRNKIQTNVCCPCPWGSGERPSQSLQPAHYQWSQNKRRGAPCPHREWQHCGPSG